MDRKAMVLAVSAALAAPSALAQLKSPAGSDWEFYGKFYPEFAHISGGGQTSSTVGLTTLAPTLTNGGNSNLVSRTEMLVSNTYIGFRGSKDIGNQMKAIWQMEQTVSLDEGTNSTLATRDTFVGIASRDWGTLRLGFMDTPFKKAGDVVGFLGVSSGNFVQTNPLLRQVGFSNAAGGPSNSASRFHERRGNAIDFASRDFFGGLSYLVQYSLGSQANPSETSITNTPKRFPRVVSQAVKWEAGPLYLAAMNEVHFDFFGGSTNATAAESNAADGRVNSKDMANQLTAMYKVGGHTFEVDYTWKYYKENGQDSNTPNGRFLYYKNQAWMAAWEARWSNTWRSALTFVHASEGNCALFATPCSTSGLEGKQVSLGGSYYLDPSVYLFLIGSKVINGASARYDNVSNGSPANGEDVTQVALGLSYTF
ncbi:MAG TPA: porin [Burkholderiales bacterium]|nr:porin [Burkholderiales bacterium]